jgi:hypothetical protein
MIRHIVCMIVAAAMMAGALCLLRISNATTIAEVDIFAKAMGIPFAVLVQSI